MLTDTLNAPANVDRLAALDFICIYGKKCKVLDKNIHGDNEFGFAEFANKREKIIEVIKFSVRNDSLSVKHTDQGFLYSINDRGRSVGYARWDFSTFDILMDGVPKSEDQGKGYRSFLNSVVALMLYKYFNKDDGFIKPGFLMIDTPLLGFDENEEEFDRETIKNGLYQYFFNHLGNGQVIIVDNLNVIPQNIGFKVKGVNVITYHKDEKDGHVYGVMPSWRKDLPKESV